MSRYDNAVKKIGDGIYRITIENDQLEVTGTGTLIGVLPDIASVKEVVLTFPQTSLNWRQRHGGPALLVVPEYAIPCIIESILWFAENNIKVSVEMPEIDGMLRC